MEDWLSAFLAREALPATYAETVSAVCVPLAEHLAARAQGQPPGFTVGICGTQASGKSTLCAVLQHLLERRGLRVAVLSLDDLYLGHAERAALARSVHPLFAVRGVPGTHDVALGEAVFDALRRPGELRLPSFDKATDDRRPESAWPVVQGPVDLILFEGWCVGARPQSPEALADPVNELEREEDPHALWRTYANDALAGPYRRIFDRLDLLMLLKAPGFEVVRAWRQEQERRLRARLLREGRDLGRTMTDTQVAAFILPYERLTRHILAEMPGRADLLVALDEHRRPVGDLVLRSADERAGPPDHRTREL